MTMRKANRLPRIGLEALKIMRSYTLRTLPKRDASNGHIFRVFGGYNVVAQVGRRQHITFIPAKNGSNAAFKVAKNEAKRVLRRNYLTVAYNT